MILKVRYENYQYFEGFYYKRIIQVDKNKWLQEAQTFKMANPHLSVKRGFDGKNYLILVNGVSEKFAFIKERRRLRVVD